MHARSPAMGLAYGGGGLSEGYFLRLQNAYDTLEAKRRIAEQVTKIKRYKPGKAA